jgi:hypothetical protein
MVSVKQAVPDVVLEADTETFLDQAQLSRTAEQRIREAEGDDAVRLMARSWFNQFHGSRHEAKKLFVLLMNEEDIPFRGEDIQAITERPPVETQT